MTWPERSPLRWRGVCWCNLNASLLINLMCVTFLSVCFAVGRSLSIPPRTINHVRKYATFLYLRQGQICFVFFLWISICRTLSLQTQISRETSVFWRPLTAIQMPRLVWWCVCKFIDRSAKTTPPYFIEWNKFCPTFYWRHQFCAQRHWNLCGLLLLRWCRTMIRPKNSHLISRSPLMCACVRA